MHNNIEDKNDNLSENDVKNKVINYDSKRKKYKICTFIFYILGGITAITAIVLMNVFINLAKKNINYLNLTFISVLLLILALLFICIGAYNHFSYLKNQEI